MQQHLLMTNIILPKKYLESQIVNPHAVVHVFTMGQMYVAEVCMCVNVCVYVRACGWSRSLLGSHRAAGLLAPERLESAASGNQWRKQTPSRE